MDKLLATIPKNLLAFLAISGGILFIILSEPPRTVCQTQIEKIKTLQTNFLYRDERWPKAKNIKTTKYKYLHDYCKTTNNPGGCFELFSEVKTLLRDLGTLTEECTGAASGVPEIRAVLWQTLDLLVRLAWGEKPPVAYHAKFGWLDTADISLYCSLKDRVVATFGEREFSAYREKLMRELPGSETLTRTQIWDMSLFSENCARYP